MMSGGCSCTYSPCAKHREREAHVMSYVVECKSVNMFFGPPPRSDGDLFYLRVTLGVRHIYNLLALPSTAAAAAAAEDKGRWYMCRFKRERECCDLMKDPPNLHREEVAFPEESIWKKTTAQQIEFFVKKAKWITDQMRKHPKEPVYIHYREGDREEALVAFLVWYMLDPSKSSPHKNLTQWLIENDYKRVLRDEEDVALFDQLILAAEKSVASNTLTSWIKRQKI